MVLKLMRSMSNRIMLMMRPENNSDVPIRMDLCRQSTDTAWENTETKRGREISLSVQCRMCLESGFLIDGSGKCLMLVRKLHSIITSSSRRIPEDIWSCIITENYHSEIICGTERQSQIQIRSIWGRTDTISSRCFSCFWQAPIASIDSSRRSTFLPFS